MPFGAALSVHPISSHATGEVIGQVVEDVGLRPDVAMLLVTPGHTGALEDVVRAVRRLLAPTVLVGAVAPALVGQGADDRRGPAMALWAGITGPAHALRLPTPPGVPRSRLRPPGVVLLGHRTPAALADVFDDTALTGALDAAPTGAFDDTVLTGAIDDTAATGALDGLDTPAAGALTGGGPLVLDDRLHAGGAVGIAFGPEVRFEAVVARGWRAVGPPVEVTESDPWRSLVLGLDGVPALDRLRRLAADEVPAADLPRMNRSLGIGPDASDAEAAICDVRGADRSNGAIAAGPLPTGATVRFWVRGDPGPDLRRVLAGREAASALVFAAEPSQRGYGEGDHDAEIVADALGTTRVVGLVAPAQIGPVGRRVRTLQGVASVALLADR